MPCLLFFYLCGVVGWLIDWGVVTILMEIILMIADMCVSVLVACFFSDVLLVLLSGRGGAHRHDT